MFVGREEKEKEKENSFSFFSFRTKNTRSIAKSERVIASESECAREKDTIAH
jgi:hypothetical protein